MGPSLGGMVVLAYAALFPGAARRLVSISGTLAASPFAIALRSIQREAITGDPDWRHGNYAADRPPRIGMSLARKLGTVTYRSARSGSSASTASRSGPTSSAMSPSPRSSRSRAISSPRRAAG